MRNRDLAFFFVLLTACSGSVEDPSSTGSSSTGSGGWGGGGPSGPESFVRLAEGTAWCAVRASGKVACWKPVLGVQDAQPLGQLTEVPGIDDATAATVQFYAGCARRASGKVSCWGTNEEGELLLLAQNSEVLTTATELPGIDAIAISSAIHSTCVIRKGGQVACFGLGNFTPVDVPKLKDAIAISGGNEGCAVRATGHVACWSSLGMPAEAISFIDDATLALPTFQGGCALHATGDVSCWKKGVPSSTVKIPGFERVTRMAVGDDEVCAIDHAGEVSCWQWDWASPAKPVDLHDAWDIGFSYNVRCVIHTTGELECGGVSGT